MSGDKPQALKHPRPTRDMDVPAEGLWPGTVVNTADPDKEGKIQVRVDQFYGRSAASEKIEDADLPWARPGCFPAGVGSGAPQVPEVGSGVWVGFWGGSRSHPVWFGGFFGEGDVPSEFSSAYSPEPKTWLTKTPHGHTIEMRWKESEEEIRVETKNGAVVRLQDASTLGGPRILMELPSGFKLVVDGNVQKIEAITPVGRALSLDDGGSLVKLDGAAGPLQLSAGTTMTLAALISMIISAVAVSVTATGILALVGAAVTVGTVAASSFVVLDSFLTSKYDIHTHSYLPGPGPSAAQTGVPVPLSAPSDQSVNVRVD